MAAISLSSLRTQVRGAFGLTDDWEDSLLNGYICDAIRIYSDEFPRRLCHSLTLLAGTQAYNLPGNHQIFSVILVEYPAGQSPAEYIYQAAEDSAVFRRKGDVFAIRPVADTVGASIDDDAGVIVFAEDVADGQSAILHYTCCHRIPTADADIITVPEMHLEAIVAFVDFRAHWEMESEEAYSQASSSSSLILSQLGENARRAWNRWREIMNRLDNRTPWATAPNPAWSNLGL